MMSCQPLNAPTQTHKFHDTTNLQAFSTFLATLWETSADSAGFSVRPQAIKHRKSAANTWLAPYSREVASGQLRTSPKCQKKKDPVPVDCKPDLVALPRNCSVAGATFSCGETGAAVRLIFWMSMPGGNCGCLVLRQVWCAPTTPLSVLLPLLLQGGGVLGCNAENQHCGGKESSSVCECPMEWHNARFAKSAF